jgi:hypothetical protein
MARVRRLILPDALRPIWPVDALAVHVRIVRGTEGYLPTVGVQHGVPPGAVQMFGGEGLVGVLLSALFVVLTPLLLPVAFLVRLLLRRPWWLEARHGGEVMRWRVRRWSDTRRAAAEIAAALEQGRTPSPANAERVLYWGRQSERERRDAELGFYPRKR